MKSISLAVALGASAVLAYPNVQAGILSKRQTAPPQGAGALPLTPPPFDAAGQYVSNQGAHAFVAPSSTDARGPCPGLNAMANHNYLPHNGQATIQQFIDATNTVFGMNEDLGGFLAFYGAIIDGNGAGWSIAGTPHTGISGSHNDYETDSSPMKSDLNQYGYNGKLIISQFYELYNMQPNAATANYNLEVIRQFRATRFQESIAKNPYFFYAPFTGVEVSQAAFTFMYRFMSNKSAEYPEGILNRDVLKSFHSVSGPDNNLTWTYGHEAIPNNWYRRNSNDFYSIPYFQADILYFAETVPQVFEVGCNTGTVNSYQAADIFALTNGAYSAQSAAANPLCFSMAWLASQLVPSLGLSGSKLSAMQSAIAKATQAIGPCTQISNPNNTILSACPGASFYGGPTGPVAPGAIQS